MNPLTNQDLVSIELIGHDVFVFFNVFVFNELH
jgi:hypothetical protein